mmetsp:Transcript_5419/g.11073  ORF Transcript_5419/g.11073 Transcript_5419/m.11073 type:complete len:132 (-) Transcript_5419:48-443(-)
MGESSSVGRWLEVETEEREVPDVMGVWAREDVAVVAAVSDVSLAGVWFESRLFLEEVAAAFMVEERELAEERSEERDGVDEDFSFMGFVWSISWGMGEVIEVSLPPVRDGLMVVWYCRGCFVVTFQYIHKI